MRVLGPLELESHVAVRCQELISGLLGEQQVLLNTEPFLQPCVSARWLHFYDSTTSAIGSHMMGLVYYSRHCFHFHHKS